MHLHKVPDDDAVEVAEDPLPCQCRHYRHYKGGRYEVICLAQDERTGIVLVVYRSMQTRKTWARPLSQWLETVETERGRVPRYQRET